jgi:hypothetical protein
LSIPYQEAPQSETNVSSGKDTETNERGNFKYAKKWYLPPRNGQEHNRSISGVVPIQLGFIPPRIKIKLRK